MVAIVIIGEIQAFVFCFFFGWLLFKDLSVFFCRMARPWKKLKRQGKVIVDNQQVNVVTNEEEIKVEHRIIIYIPTFERKP